MTNSKIALSPLARNLLNDMGKFMASEDPACQQCSLVDATAWDYSKNSAYMAIEILRATGTIKVTENIAPSTGTLEFTILLPVENESLIISLLNNGVRFDKTSNDFAGQNTTGHMQSHAQSF